MNKLSHLPIGYPPSPSQPLTGNILGWVLMGGWLTYSLAFLGWQLMNDPLLLQIICRG